MYTQSILPSSLYCVSVSNVVDLSIDCRNNVSHIYTIRWAQDILHYFLQFIEIYSQLSSLNLRFCDSSLSFIETIILTCTSITEVQLLVRLLQRTQCYTCVFAQAVNQLKLSA
ncbi:hypothetical protein EVA_08143 [gut metagenome]|uniref:Uncharacterized protein n=1 Tax=gut metagenome TaxID=749906 RepID=J9GTQ2_9ZZZZ